MMQLQPSTIRSKRNEKIAKGVVYVFVAFTLLVLVWIVGYVLFKGFVTIGDNNYDVTPHTVETLISEEYPDTPYLLITHDKVRVKEILETDIVEMFTKRRQHNWGDITTQNLKIWPFMYAEGTGYFDSASALVTTADDDELGDYVSYVKTPQEALDYIANVEGAVGLVPAGMFTEEQLKAVRVVGVRRVSLAVNSSVMNIVDNQQLREIASDEIDSLFDGTYTNWSEVGGYDLPVVPLMYADGSVYEGLTAQEGSTAQVYTDKEAFLTALETTPGAIARVTHIDMVEQDLNFLEIKTHEVKANLTIHYLIEEPARSGAWGGISTIIINTFVLILATLLFSTPIGVMAAVYLVEYSAQNRFIKLLRLGTETLAGIPSIVFGLFGYIFFVGVLNLGIGFISATLTVTLMILPTIIRTSEEALKSVPNTYREGSLALGATKLKTIYKVVLPAASPGILSGIILAMGRVIGETAVLIYTLGSNYELVSGPKSSARVLSLHIYNLFAEAISFERSFATATVLIFMILLVNYGTNTMIGRISKQQRS